MEFRPRIWTSGEVEVELEVDKTQEIQQTFLSSQSSGGKDGLDLEASLPTIFSREEGRSESVSKMRDFFKKEGGSVAVSEALCITHRVDIRKHNQSKLFIIRYIDFKMAKRMR